MTPDSVSSTSAGGFAYACTRCVVRSFCSPFAGRLLGRLLRNNTMNVAQLVASVLQGFAQHARQHHALCSSGCDGHLVRGTFIGFDGNK